MLPKYISSKKKIPRTKVSQKNEPNLCSSNHFQATTSKSKKYQVLKTVSPVGDKQKSSQADTKQIHKSKHNSAQSYQCNQSINQGIQVFENIYLKQNLSKKHIDDPTDAQTHKRYQVNKCRMESQSADQRKANYQNHYQLVAEYRRKRLKSRSYSNDSLYESDLGSQTGSSESSSMSNNRVRGLGFRKRKFRTNSEDFEQKNTHLEKESQNSGGGKTVLTQRKRRAVHFPLQTQKQKEYPQTSDSTLKTPTKQQRNQSGKKNFKQNLYVEEHLLSIVRDLRKEVTECKEHLKNQQSQRKRVESELKEERRKSAILRQHYRNQIQKLKRQMNKKPSDQTKVSVGNFSPQKTNHSQTNLESLKMKLQSSHLYSYDKGLTTVNRHCQNQTENGNQNGSTILELSGEETGFNSSLMEEYENSTFALRNYGESILEPEELLTFNPNRPNAFSRKTVSNLSLNSAEGEK